MIIKIYRNPPTNVIIKGVNLSLGDRMGSYWGKVYNQFIAAPPPSAPRDIIKEGKA